jgi:serine/threonine protein kinase
MRSLSGSTLAGYQVLELLGQGGMGAVYRARQPQLSRDVAIKVLEAPASDPELLSRFIRETRIHQGLSHPHLVKVIDGGQANEFRYLVLELVQGLSLREFIDKNAPLPLDFALPTALALAEALEYLHGRGIVHRDLKPGNVLLDRAGHAKLADLGLSLDRELTPITRQGAMMGTLKYMAPELLTSQGSQEASDIYALGVTLYEMVTGCVPFNATEMNTWVHQVCFTPPVPMRERVPNVPEDVGNLVDELLAKEPASRPPARAVVLRLTKLGAVKNAANTQNNLQMRTIRLSHSSRNVPATGRGSMGLRLPLALLCCAALAAVLWYVRPASTDQTVVSSFIERREQWLKQSPLPPLPSIPGELGPVARALAADQERWMARDGADIPTLAQNCSRLSHIFAQERRLWGNRVPYTTTTPETLRHIVETTGGPTTRTIATAMWRLTAGKREDFSSDSLKTTIHEVNHIVKLYPRLSAWRDRMLEPLVLQPTTGLLAANGLFLLSPRAVAALVLTQAGRTQLEESLALQLKAREVCARCFPLMPAVTDCPTGAFLAVELRWRALITEIFARRLQHALANPQGPLPNGWDREDLLLLEHTPEIQRAVAAYVEELRRQRLAHPFDFPWLRVLLSYQCLVHLAPGLAMSADSPLASTFGLVKALRRAPAGGDGTDGAPTTEALVDYVRAMSSTGQTTVRNPPATRLVLNTLLRLTKANPTLAASHRQVFDGYLACVIRRMVERLDNRFRVAHLNQFDVLAASNAIPTARESFAAVQTDGRLIGYLGDFLTDFPPDRDHATQQQTNAAMVGGIRVLCCLCELEIRRRHPTVEFKDPKSGTVPVSPELVTYLGAWFRQLERWLPLAAASGPTGDTLTEILLLYKSIGERMRQLSTQGYRNATYDQLLKDFAKRLDAQTKDPNALALTATLHYLDSVTLAGRELPTEQARRVLREALAAAPNQRQVLESLRSINRSPETNDSPAR